ncbi:hypothetical protein DI270_006010 [Microbispora triticiradicis]|uniref:DUF11 domain-containing protein n=3 Tax=Microbispora TaxID=2005 RepID=A0ABY3M434_9ACTN|nr:MULTISPECIES: CARDB domain-containing protein [Microbispora]RGA05937.1 hypothetical protein DI270_006010 [Microbispora triticiradicis]TLP62224.1 hypothetical protein FED44_09690 [Microbispora fusca]TYB66332.1 hypothetical protein FXF59_05090 [Microbispora tritici]GLW21983.1 hypothetical protein Mame01_20260 [Microbispora amethystogenes]
MGRRVVTGLVCVFVAGTPHPALAAPGAAPAQGRWGTADLMVGITASPKVAQPGQPLTYHVSVHNQGPGDAVLPTLRVRLPRDFQILNVGVAECGPGSVRNEVVCRSSDDVLPGGSGDMTITGMIRPGAHGPLRARADLTSEVLDDDETDNTAETVTRVDEGADLAMRFSSSTRYTRPGHWFAVRAEVRNRGPRVVRDAYVFFQPQEARLLSATGARCHRNRQFVGCSLPPIRSGSRGLLKLVFRVPSRASRAVATMATVYSRRFGDRRPANNQASMRVALRRA